MENTLTSVVNIIWLLVSVVIALMAFWGGRFFGKASATTRLKVMEERLLHKQTEVQNFQTEIEKASLRAEQYLDDIKDKDILLAELNVRLAAVEEEGKQKLSFVLGAKDQLKSEFHTVAQALLDEKSEKFVAQNRSSLTQLLSPLKDQLSQFSNQVSEVYDKDLRDRISLLKEITELKSINSKMSGEALNLTRALKGDNKLQGNWGEMVLERVLEMSGLQRDREYLLQPSYKSEKGALLRPDAVIQLPEGKSVVVDSKVSLKHWELVTSAETKGLAIEAMRKHVDSLKNHIKNLSGKEYEGLPGISSLDFVLMFVPIEAAFVQALDADPELYDLANNKNIMMVCPSTLLVTLKAIRFGWQQDRQNRNALLIAQRAGALHDQFVLFVESLDDVGECISKASVAFETSRKRLVSGKGNLIGRVSQLEELGAKTKKNLLIKSELEE